MCSLSLKTDACLGNDAVRMDVISLFLVHCWCPSRLIFSFVCIGFPQLGAGTLFCLDRLSQLHKDSFQSLVCHRLSQMISPESSLCGELLSDP